MFRSLAIVPVLVVAPAALAGPRVLDVKTEAREGGAAVVLTASEPLTFQSWQAGGNVIVDLLETEGQPATQPGSGPIAGVDVTRHDARGVPMTRLTVKAAPGQEHDVTADGNTLTVSVFGKGTRPVDTAQAIATTAPVKVASATPRPIVEGEAGRATIASDAVYLAQAGGARQMTYIGFKNNAAQSRVFVRLNESAEFDVRKQGDNLVVLELRNTTIPLRNNKNHLDTTFFDSPVKMITPSEIEDASPTVRVVIEMKAAVPFETKVEGKEIAVYFKR